MGLSACQGTPGSHDEGVGTPQVREAADADTRTVGVRLPPGVPATYYADMAEWAEIITLNDPPTVHPLRAVDQDEYDRVQVDCLVEFGVDARLEPSGGFSVHSGDREQGEANERLEFICLGRYPLHERYQQRFALEQLEVYYAWMVEETIPCMESLGYPTPVPPTKETFVANYEARGELFFPDTELDPSTIAGDMVTIMEQCDVMPPDEALYG